MWEGLLLGLSNGIACLTTCSQVLLPLLLGEGKDTRHNAGMVLQFLGGRLLGYLLFAFLAWAGSRWVHPLTENPLLYGLLYVLLGIMMFAYGFLYQTESCGLQRPARGMPSRIRQRMQLFPFGLGLVLGVNLCPPFLAAFAIATRYTHFYQTVIFFLAFFLGTSAFFLPLPLIGWVRKRETGRLIGKLASGIVGIFYLYSGMIMIYGGLVV